MKPRKTAISLIFSLMLTTSLVTATSLYIVEFEAEAYQIPDGMSEISLGKTVSVSFQVDTSIEDIFPSNEIIGEYISAASEISLNINDEESITASSGNVKIENDFADILDTFTLRSLTPNIQVESGNLGVFTPTIIQFRNTTDGLNSSTTSSDQLLEGTLSLPDYEFSALSIWFESSDPEIRDGQVNFRPISGSYEMLKFPIREKVRLDLSYISNQQKSYQLYESNDLVTWSKMGEKIRGSGQLEETIVESREPMKFYRFSIEDVFSSITINPKLADQILGDGLLVEPGIYASANNTGNFSLRASLEGIEITSQGTWTWSVSDDDFDIVTFNVAIDRYIIGDLSFSGSPESLASRLGTPVVKRETAIITFTGIEAGYFDSEIFYTDNSQETEPREDFDYR